MLARPAQTRLYSPPLDIVHVARDDAEPFTFAAFDDRLADAVEFAGDDHLLAISSGAIAIWSVSERRRTVLASPADHFSAHAARTHCRARRSIFVIEHGPGVASVLRELALDGSVDRSIPLPQGWVSALGAMADGTIVAARPDGFLLIDPDTGAWRERRLPAWFEATVSEKACNSILGISADGRLAVRCHVGSVARFPAGAIDRFERSELRAATDWTALASAPEGEGCCYGFAYEIFSTETGELVDRLLGGLVTETALRRRMQGSGWSDPKASAHLATIDALADRYPYTTWDAASQLLFRRYEWGDDAARRAVDAVSFPFGFLLGYRVRWSDDPPALIVPAGERMLRTVGLDGTVGASVCAPPVTPDPAPAAAVKRIRAKLTAGSTVPIDVADMTVAGAVAALTEVADRIEAGLEPLLFRDTLAIEFRHGRRRIGETRFFAEIGALPNAAPLVAPLRRMVGSFGAQALQLAAHGWRRIRQGERSRPEHWRAALSPAALLLAQLDFGAGDALRDWVLCVDQEHDAFAAAKVLPAFARTSRYADAEALRFGLFFLLQQWQTIADGPVKAIWQAARRFPPEAVAAWMGVEGERIRSARRAGDAQPDREQYTGLLDAAKAWDGAFLEALSSQVARP